MSKHSERRRKARMIRAADRGELIQCEATHVDWIIAADAGEQQDQPKRFSMTAYTGGAMVVGYYGSPVVIDLSGLKAESPIPILLDHDATRIVGHADEVALSDASLKLKGIVSGGGESAKEVIASSKSGFPWKASVGVVPEKLEFVGEDIATKVNGKSFKGPLYVARKATLRETSFVAVAADNRTSAKVAATAAQHQKEKPMEPKFQEWIEAMGLVATELREDQIAKLQAKYDAELKAAVRAAAEKPPVEANGKPPEIKVAVPEFDLRGIVLAHEKHVVALDQIAAKYPNVEKAKAFELRAAAGAKALDLKSSALNDEWATIRMEAEHVKAASLFEVEMVRAERPTAPAIHASSRDSVVNSDVLAAAIFASGRIDKPETHCKPEHLEAAHRQFPRGLGLQELIVAAAQANGWQGHSFRQDGTNCMRFAFKPIQAGGWSTVAITGILSNVANKFLLEGFNFVEQAWRAISSIRPVNDFKTITSYRMTGATTYQLVPPSGEIPHGTLGEESYTNKADTYGLMLAVNRTDIINDDLGAITAVPRNLGTGAGRTLNHVFWTVYLGAQSTLFTAGRSNYISGASSALAIDSLTLAEKTFMDLKDADSQPIGHTPRVLLVPTALSATAAALANSTEIRDTTASTKYPVFNPHMGKFTPVVSRYMGNTAYTGASATAWNLLASPQEVATVEVCFLNGQQSPTVEQADADFDTLGVQMRGYFDFGVNDQDYRGGVRSAGA